MFIFDQLKREDRQLQLISIGVLAGMFVLLAALWYHQIVSNKRYEESLKKQSFKSIRVPAIRGKILDRNGQVLSQNKPRVNVNLYLEELPSQFYFEYTNTVLKEYRRQHPGAKVSVSTKDALRREARYRVVSNITQRLSSISQKPSVLDPRKFQKHCTENPYVPFPIMRELNAKQKALFSEQLANEPGIDLEIQPVRDYPNNSLAAHLLGYVQRRENPHPEDDEEAVKFNYYLPDFGGKTGVEGWFDSELRGTAGAKQVLVNNVSYRQQEKDMVIPSEPGKDIYLTIDSTIQDAAEKALARAMADARGAAVVMDVRTGDVLAMASAPTYDPNIWVEGVSEETYAFLNDEKRKHMFNRAVYGAYPPGSIFKIITAFACLEDGLNPNEQYDNQGWYRLSPNSRPIDDKAPAGPYDFKRAFYKSSNSYFIHYGLRTGLQKLLEMGKRFHLGELTKIVPEGQEVTGSFPTPDDAVGVWRESRTANACIGQEITVTPIQMAVMTCAVANGGKLFWPRIISHLQAQDTGAKQELFAQGRIRENIRLNPRHLEIVHHAMLLDTENPDATAYSAFHEGGSPPMANMRVGGKTGTAEISYPVKDQITWFVSFGPFENPRYAVVVMVESGASGGRTCAKAAYSIYQTLARRDQATGAAGVALQGTIPSRVASQN